MHEKKRPERVNERKASKEYKFVYFGSEMLNLPTSWKVRVFAFFPEIIMMVRVINSKADGGRKTHSDVTEDGKGLVKKDVGMPGPVGEIVDQNMACVPDGSAEYIKHEHIYCPMRILE